MISSNSDATKPSPDMSLRGIAGACAGEVYALTPDADLSIGRQNKGVHVADPQVSLEHAVIRWDEFRGYMISDLGSVRGTVVDRRRVGEKPVVLKVDSRVYIGDAVFLVENREQKRLRRVEKLAFWLFAVSLVVLVFFMLLPAGEPPERMLLWSAPVRQGDVVSRQVLLDDLFLRSMGIDTDNLMVNRVDDSNGDEIDEMWFSDGDVVHVVTFESAGNWVLLGELPKGCAEKSKPDPGRYPDYDCGAVEYSYYEGEFRPVEQNGVVIWGVPKGAWNKPGNAPADKVVARRMPLRHPQALAGFLAASGIGSGAHYILCEDALGGLQPQALLFDGTQRVLSVGCRDAVEVSGVDFSEIRGVGLTAHGYEALLEDLRIHLGGSRSDLFLDEKWGSVLEAWSTPPTPIQAQTWAGFDGVPHFFNPIAQEGAIARPRSLVWEGSIKPAPSVVVATIASSGEAKLDLPGCAMLKLYASDWFCDVSEGCLASARFITAKEVGCGVVRDVGFISYEQDRSMLEIDGLDVVLAIESKETLRGIEVIQAQVAWRATTEE